MPSPFTRITRGAALATEFLGRPEATARECGVEWLTTEASIAAPRFFERRGLAGIKPADGPRPLPIYRMEKR